MWILAIPLASTNVGPLNKIDSCRGTILLQLARLKRAFASSQSRGGEPDGFILRIIEGSTTKVIGKSTER
jgi:hypothetical protein